MAIDLGPGPDGNGLALAAREADGRNIRLTLSDDLATGLMRLLEQALVATDWGILAPAADVDAAQDGAGSTSPVTWN